MGGEKQNVLRATSLLALSEATAGNQVRAKTLMNRTEALMDSVEQNADFKLVYWRLSQAHERLQNVAAQSLYLEKAYSALTEQAKKILDASMRKSFLMNVKVNREIAATWKQAAGK